MKKLIKFASLTSILLFSLIASFAANANDLEKLKCLVLPFTCTTTLGAGGTGHGEVDTLGAGGTGHGGGNTGGTGKPTGYKSGKNNEVFNI